MIFFSYLERTYYLIDSWRCPSFSFIFEARPVVFEIQPTLQREHVKHDIYIQNIFCLLYQSHDSGQFLRITLRPIFYMTFFILYNILYCVFLQDVVEIKNKNINYDFAFYQTNFLISFLFKWFQKLYTDFWESRWGWFLYL